MARKPHRDDPMEEGVLKEIYRLFIGKLIFFKPVDTPIKDWLEELFHVKYRDIVRYRVLRAFRMPGLYYVAPNSKIQGIGTRDVPEGTVIYVRTDTRHPDNNDVQWVGREDRQFCLTSTELGAILLNCEPDTRKARPREKDRDEF